MKEIAKTYNPQENEKSIYSLWEKSGFFNPDNLKAKKPFVILMPPPNANDPLHIGHAVFVTLQDLMIRYNRMNNKKALWLPGADHAGFETQVVYEKKLEKEGRSRFKMQREDFYKEVFKYTQENRKTVKSQLKKLGASCDWSRDVFTLDDKVIKTTYQIFKKMFDDGLVYRGERLVNYCTKHRTAFSDLEIEKEEKKDPLYYIKYGPIRLATVRPETKFGDTAIAVHPRDKRYKKYINKEIEIETLSGKTKIRVIGDKFVDPDFGTGAVKVTPAHDQNDFEIWLRHKEEIPGPIQVIGEDGRLTEKAGPYQGLLVEEARERVVVDMKKAGLIEKVDENYTHNVSVCYKCKKTIEPMLKEQWFVKAAPLAQPAIEAVKKKKIEIIPKNYEKIYFHWLKNIKDWNISRQNWWGISIPAWQCKRCNRWLVTRGESPKKCSFCNSKEMHKDSDVFDTWFSSGQWTFASLGYPDSKDFKEFYPSSVMETGYDIFFFWVIRMVMLGIYATDKIPFEKVYLHGLVRAKDGQKMSKSKGNVIDPITVVDNYGSDALRMSLVIGNMPGRDLVISEEKIKGYRNFINKVWNIFRFIEGNTADFKDSSSIKLSVSDKKIIDDFDKIAKKVDVNIKKFKFSHAAEKLYHYVWHNFADKVIENSKDLLQDKKTRRSRQKTLLYVFTGILKLLHPFAPFVTEKIYQSISLTKKKEVLMIENWPKTR